MLLLAQRESYSLSDVQTDASHTAAGGLDISLSGLLKYSLPADADAENIKDISITMLKLVILMGANVIQSGLVKHRFGCRKVVKQQHPDLVYTWNECVRQCSGSLHNDFM